MEPNKVSAMIITFVFLFGRSGCNFRIVAIEIVDTVPRALQQPCRVDWVFRRDGMASSSLADPVTALRNDRVRSGKRARGETPWLEMYCKISSIFLRFVVLISSVVTRAVGGREGWHCLRRR